MMKREDEWPGKVSLFAGFLRIHSVSAQRTVPPMAAAAGAYLLSPTSLQLTLQFGRFSPVRSLSSQVCILTHQSLGFLCVKDYEGSLVAPSKMNSGLLRAFNMLRDIVNLET